jgi:hypothetical protein
MGSIADDGPAKANPFLGPVRGGRVAESEHRSAAVLLVAVHRLPIATVRRRWAERQPSGLYVSRYFSFLLCHFCSRPFTVTIIHHSVSFIFHFHHLLLLCTPRGRELN